MILARPACTCHVAVLSIHASSSSNLPRFPRAYPFLTQFLRPVLGVFRNSKWVMQHIVGKLSTSSFQRYKVYVNRSLDERVMAPGSRGVGAVFVHFSDEDSSQTGNAIGEPRVPRHSWSRYLSNAPGLPDQLVVSWKDSAREGGCPGGKTRKNSPDTPTSGSHNSLVQTPICANFIPLERGRRELSDDMLHDPF